MPGCEYSLLFILSLALNPALYILHTVFPHKVHVF